MNRVAPMKSMRSMSAPPFGTLRLSARPARNAPTIASMPMTSASEATTNSATMT